MSNILNFCKKKKKTACAPRMHRAECISSSAVPREKKLPARKILLLYPYNRVYLGFNVEIEMQIQAHRCARIKLVISRGNILYWLKLVRQFLQIETLISCVNRTRVHYFFVLVQKCNETFTRCCDDNYKVKYILVINCKMNLDTDI